MKKTIFLSLIILSIVQLTAQTTNLKISNQLSESKIQEALLFQNQYRSYFNLAPLSIDKKLTLQAQAWANHLSKIDSLKLSDGNEGETVYAIGKGAEIPNNIILDAVVGWFVPDENDSNVSINPGYYQQLCNSCRKVGFGISENQRNIYVVAKFDYLYN